MGIMYKQVLSIFCLAALAQASPQPKDLLCDICIDVVTYLAEWITSETTEGEIVHFMESICRQLGGLIPDLEAACIELMEEQLPAIIDGMQARAHRSTIATTGLWSDGTEFEGIRYLL